MNHKLFDLNVWLKQFVKTKPYTFDNMLVTLGSSSNIAVERNTPPAKQFNNPITRVYLKWESLISEWGSNIVERYKISFVPTYIIKLSSIFYFKTNYLHWKEQLLRHNMSIVLKTFKLNYYNECFLNMVWYYMEHWWKIKIFITPKRDSHHNIICPYSFHWFLFIFYIVPPIYSLRYQKAISFVPFSNTVL